MTVYELIIQYAEVVVQQRGRRRQSYFLVHVCGLTLSHCTQTGTNSRTAVGWRTQVTRLIRALQQARPVQAACQLRANRTSCIVTSETMHTQVQGPSQVVCRATGKLHLTKVYVRVLVCFVPFLVLCSISPDIYTAILSMVQTHSRSLGVTLL